MRRAAAILLFAAAACRLGRRPSSTDTIATIDDSPVSLSSFRADFETNAGRPIAESSPKVVSALFDQFLKEETWRRLARLRQSDPALARREAPAALLAVAGAQVVPSPEEVRAEYARHPERYHRPAEARVSRIFTRSREAAEKAQKRLEDGEDFAAVARSASQAPDAAQGGAMGTLARGDLPSEFESAIFRLEPGGRTGILAAEDGFLLFELEEKLPERQLSFEESEPEIRRRLSREKANAYLARRVEELKKSGRIVVFADRLPFVYSGEFVPQGESR